ncbi:unnamed protein product [Cylicostephanus goldi]|uniref:Uncharacterized protein n=1 Tax=Cylicostephanus goldi TaxID=71465 RepID=A0A3P7N4V4_CYLGO|nr:unnamed protein product [Cylicostephanus goldi]
MKMMWFLSKVLGDEFVNAINMSPDEVAVMTEIASNRPRNKEEVVL